MRRIRLQEAVQVMLTTGHSYILAPDPEGGVTVRTAGQPAAAASERSGQRGRPASPATMELRRRLAEDHAKGEMREMMAYAKELAKSARTSQASAYQTVRREYARVVAGGDGGEGKGKGGRKSPARDMLRERLAADRAEGASHDAAHYIRWLVDAASIGLKQARPIVHAELRSAR